MQTVIRRTNERTNKQTNKQAQRRSVLKSRLCSGLDHISESHCLTINLPVNMRLTQMYCQDVPPPPPAPRLLHPPSLTDSSDPHTHKHKLPVKLPSVAVLDKSSGTLCLPADQKTNIKKIKSNQFHIFMQMTFCIWFRSWDLISKNRIGHSELTRGVSVDGHVMTRHTGNQH